MKNARALLYVGFMLLTAVTVIAADGAASKDELAKLYQRYFEAKDSAKLNMLVYWPGVQARERDTFTRSIQYDLGYQLAKVEFVPLKSGEKLEYSLDTVTFRPSLPPVVRMVATYQGHGNIKNLSTSYLVGVKDGRYYITLAAPVKSVPRSSK